MGGEVHRARHVPCALEGIRNTADGCAVDGRENSIELRGSVTLIELAPGPCGPRGPGAPSTPEGPRIPLALDWPPFITIEGRHRATAGGTARLGLGR
jgi:hypothetical protein